MVMVIMYVIKMVSRMPPQQDICAAKLCQAALSLSWMPRYRQLEAIRKLFLDASPNKTVW